jgi:hypothetical protein
MDVEHPMGARYDAKHAKGESQPEEQHGLAAGVLMIGRRRKNPVRRVYLVIISAPYRMDYINLFRCSFVHKKSKINPNTQRNLLVKCRRYHRSLAVPLTYNNRKAVMLKFVLISIFTCPFFVFFVLNVEDHHRFIRLTALLANLNVYIIIRKRHN